MVFLKRISVLEIQLHDCYSAVEYKELSSLKISSNTAKP